MGNKFEVCEWCKCDDGRFLDKYDWHQRYSGESFVVSLFIMIKLKIEGVKCIKLEWR